MLPMPNGTEEVEAAILNAVISNAPVTLAAAPDLREKHFSNGNYGQLWSRILTRVADHKGVDITLVDADREACGIRWEELHGKYVFGVPWNAAYYAEQIWQGYARRQLSELGEVLHQRANDSDQNTESIMTYAKEQLDGLHLLESNLETTETIFAKAAQSFEDTTLTHGLLSGFRTLDKITGGFRPGEMWVVAARPSVGKSSIVGQMLSQVCCTSGASGLMVNLEQTNLAIARRMASARAGVCHTTLPFSTERETKIAALKLAASEIAKAKITFSQRAGQTAAQITSLAHRIHWQNPLNLIVVDYLQLIAMEHRQDRYSAITQASQSMKRIAVELNVTTIVVSQLNRAAMDSDHPAMHHLRESGGIEQDADVILLMSRNVKRDDLPISWRDQVTDDYLSRLVRIDVAKNRDGARGECFLEFDAPCTRFLTPEIRKTEKKKGLPYAD